MCTGSVRHDFESPNICPGLSFTVGSPGSNEEINAQLSVLAGVFSVS